MEVSDTLTRLLVIKCSMLFGRGLFMRLRSLIVGGLFLLAAVFTSSSVLAEDKSYASGMIPKLQKTPNDPELGNNFVYPMWGPVCQRYTYTVTYRDKEGRPPEYMRIIFNGQPVEMEKANPADSDYKKGVRYEYKFVPDKIGSNFYYFEASNGLGKARASIIDSPDNGPVLFEADFLDNEIALIDTQTGEKIISYPTGEEWVGGVALSDDGKYLVAKTSHKVILFDTAKPKAPVWVYTYGENQMMVGGDLKGGVDMAGDGSKIIASIGSSVLLFDRASNEPVWKYDIESNAYNVAVSKDGNYMAAATGGTESDLNSNLLILWNEKSSKPLWQYHAAGNFHDVSLSDDGKYITGSTGCPDRRYYLFSKESNNPLVRSEVLTRDSPVHRAKISADGRLAAVGSESDRGAVFLFSGESKEPVWEFPTRGRSSVRALNFTPDGKYIGAATLGGQAYIFASEASEPVATWAFEAALGGVDIADDGSFIVVGGTDNKAHILSRDKKTNIEIPLAEYVEEVDIAANGRYVAVGTGGSVYFFETIPNSEGRVYPCASVIEPRPIEEVLGGGVGAGGGEKLGVLGREVGERRILDMVFRSGFLASVVAVIFLTAVRKIKALAKVRVFLIIFLSALAAAFLLLIIASVFIGGGVQPIAEEEALGGQESQGVCGNDICEPDLEENKEQCPQDCSAGD